MSYEPQRASETIFVPLIRVRGGTSLETIEPTLITEPSPTVTPGKITQREPIQTPSPMVIGAVVIAPARRSLDPITWEAVRNSTS